MMYATSSKGGRGTGYAPDRLGELESLDGRVKGKRRVEPVDILSRVHLLSSDGSHRQHGVDMTHPRRVGRGDERRWEGMS